MLSDIPSLPSGITRDGRTLQWQGMIWDNASNWDEEDIRALLNNTKIKLSCPG
jgi:hypothetical protein